LEVYADTKVNLGWIEHFAKEKPGPESRRHLRKPASAQTMSERFYTGESDGQVIVREGAARSMLNPRHDLRNKDPAEALKHGEAWSEQVALALLADALGNESQALRLYRRFYQRVVTTFPERWTMTRSRIQAHVMRM
jgi:Family of unknown function (DUF6166)